MPRIFPIRGQRNNEELFFEHYPQLLKWALQLSDLDRNNAEDLVQDFYLQIVHINVVLAEIAELEPYLFKILRNLHYSRLRRQGKSTRYELSIVDFDSIEQGLAGVDRNNLLLVHAKSQIHLRVRLPAEKKVASGLHLHPAVLSGVLLQRSDEDRLHDQDGRGSSASGRSK
jgi:DNA-directed RNA polymerase specialized sigma24 family protein